MAVNKAGMRGKESLTVSSLISYVMQTQFSKHTGIEDGMRKGHKAALRDIGAHRDELHVCNVG